MLVRRRFYVAALMAVCCCASAHAQLTPAQPVTPTPGGPQVTEEMINGVKHQVTRHVVKTQMPVTVMQDRQQTVHTPKVSTETITHKQVYSVPFTQYEVVPVLQNRWNPFEEPYYTYETQLVTRYQEQVVDVQIPVSKTEWVTETKTVQVPVTEYRMGEREIVTRVALTGGETGKTFASTQPTTAAPASLQPLTQSNNAIASQQPAANYPVQATQLPTYPPTQPSTGYGQQAYTMPAASVATRPANDWSGGQPSYGGQMLQADPPKQSSGWSNLPNNGSGYR